MAYIDLTYYRDTFKGNTIPENEFTRISEIASDTVSAICYIKPKFNILLNNQFKNDVFYEAELIYEQGGVDAILGMSDASQAGGEERLANYSISGGSAKNGSSLKMYNGIPISPMAEMLLRNLGLMSRWAYAEFVPQ